MNLNLFQTSLIKFPGIGSLTEAKGAHPSQKQLENLTKVLYSLAQNVDTFIVIRWNKTSTIESNQLIIVTHINGFYECKKNFNDNLLYFSVLFLF